MIRSVASSFIGHPNGYCFLMKVDQRAWRQHLGVDIHSDGCLRVTHHAMQSLLFAEQLSAVVDRNVILQAAGSPKQRVPAGTVRYSRLNPLLHPVANRYNCPLH